MECPGMGETWGDFRIVEGYAWSHDLRSVFACSTFLGCPGGVPGTCKPGRVNTSLACADCEAGKAAHPSGECRTCSTGDRAFVASLVVMLALLSLVMYRAIDRENRAKQRQSTVLITLVFGQMVTVVQQLGIIGTLSVTFPEPILSLLQWSHLAVIDIDVLRFDCVAQLTPVLVYLSKICVFASAFVALALSYIVVTLVERGARQLKLRLSSLICALGTLFMTVFISITSVILEPMVCVGHPGGHATPKNYPTVLCWESHIHWQLISASCALLVGPMSFLVGSLYVLREFPLRMQASDVAFLHSYAFLFFRFRPEVHWYSIVLLLRNTLSSIIPVVPDPVWQIELLGTLLIFSLVLMVRVFPWRITKANLLDAGCTIGVLLLVHVSAFFVPHPLRPQSSSALVYLCIVFVFIGLTGPPLVLAYNAYLKLKQRRFRFFICHQKANSGALARLLKIMIIEAKACTVFIDSDNLTNLEVLFDFVAQRTDTIVVLASYGSLTSPWCLGEICTAQLHEVHLFGVRCPDCPASARDPFVRNLADIVTGLDVIAAKGMGVLMLQESLKWFFTQDFVDLPLRLQQSQLLDVVNAIRADAGMDSGRTSQPLKRLSLQSTDLEVLSEGRDESEIGIEEATRANASSHFAASAVLKRKHQKTVTVNSRTAPHLVIVSDDENREATAAARILAKLMLPGTVHISSGPPFVLMDLAPAGDLNCLEPELPRTTETVVLVCTRDCFASSHILKSLISAADLEASVLPVVSDQSFAFPTRIFYETLRNTAIELLASTTLEDRAPTVVGICEHIFKEIAPVFHPHGSEKLLRQQSAVVVDRLMKRKSSMPRNIMKAEVERTTKTREEKSRASAASASSAASTLMTGAASEAVASSHFVGSEAQRASMEDRVEPGPLPEDRELQDGTEFQDKDADPGDRATADAAAAAQPQARPHGTSSVRFADEADSEAAAPDDVLLSGASSHRSVEIVKEVEAIATSDNVQVIDNVQVTEDAQATSDGPRAAADLVGHQWSRSLEEVSSTASIPGLAGCAHCGFG